MYTVTVLFRYENPQIYHLTPSPGPGDESMIRQLPGPKSPFASGRQYQKKKIVLSVLIGHFFPLGFISLLPLLRTDFS
jgi:hypothetical protein